MSDADKKARDDVIASGFKDQGLMKVMLAVDASNLPRIKQIDARQGFPTAAQVGYDGVQAAFILVQHADSDPAFQMHVLDELKSRLNQGDVGVWNFTLLTDRVLLAQHKPQRYGTQFWVSNENGKIDLKPKLTEDPANVDKRRAAIGLPPLADYKCMTLLYSTPAAKS